MAIAHTTPKPPRWDNRPEMATRLSLSDAEDEQLQRIADIIAGGNKTEAVRRMIELFGDPEAAVRAQHDDLEDDRDDDVSVPDEGSLELDEARALASRAGHQDTETKTHAVGRYLKSLDGAYHSTDELVDHITDVLGCGWRAAKYEYIGRLISAGYVAEGPDTAIDMDDVWDAYTYIDIDSTASEQKIKSADSVSDIVGFGPDYIRDSGNAAEAGWRQFWVDLDDGRGGEQMKAWEMAVVEAADDADVKVSYFNVVDV